MIDYDNMQFTVYMWISLFDIPGYSVGISKLQNFVRNSFTLPEELIIFVQHSCLAVQADILNCANLSNEITLEYSGVR